MRDPAIPGNVLTVDDFRFGRLGNRFWALGVNLKLGYCCKSKLVSAGRRVSNSQCCGQAFKLIWGDPVLADDGKPRKRTYRILSRKNRNGGIRCMAYTVGCVSGFKKWTGVPGFGPKILLTFHTPITTTSSMSLPLIDGIGLRHRRR